MLNTVASIVSTCTDATNDAPASGGPGAVAGPSQIVDESQSQSLRAVMAVAGVLRDAICEGSAWEVSL